MWVNSELMEWHPNQIEAIYAGLMLSQELAHTISVKSGWYIDPVTGDKIEKNFGETIALMHSELSEALEAHRKGKTYDDKLTDKDAVAVELADCIIRILDTASHMNLNIADAFVSKCKYNMYRDDHKLENRAKDGGKKY